MGSWIHKSAFRLEVHTGNLLQMLPCHCLELCHIGRLPLASEKVEKPMFTSSIFHRERQQEEKDW